MGTQSANTFGDFGTAAAIVIASFVIAKLVGLFLKGTIEKGHLGPLSVANKNTLLRIPALFRFFIITQGCLIAFNLFNLESDSLKLASTVETTITILRDVFLFLGLAITSRAGFAAWANRLSGTQANNGGNKKQAESSPVNVKVRMARTLIDIFLLPLAIVIFLPDLDLNIPKEQILYAADFFLLAIGGVLAFIIVNIHKQSSTGKTNIGAQTSIPQEQFETMAGEDPDFPLIVDIVSLFLEIAKHHLGAEKDTPCRFKLVEHNTAVSKYLFDLEVHIYGSWKNKRITVGRLAADSGSRSKCFYAIYNEYLVIKVPPIPITDPAEYVDSMKLEAGISKHLDMAACIIPIVSVMLKYIDKSIDAKADDQYPAEKRALIALNLHPELFQFLKVGQAFAYFMDMSKYYFLQNVIEMLHQAPDPNSTVSLMRIKTPVEGLTANLLDLLAHINKKGVALRDLKPDNLLVAGDRDSYPHFLSKPEEYLIGLIDIETAVIYGNRHWKSIAQPSLGGSPRHATPSHFFENGLINQLYGDVADILHLQDWQGMISVIFKVITDRYIFEKTALLFPGIIHGLNAPSEEENIRKIAVETSREFWCSAKPEFRERMVEESAVLEQVMVPLAESVVSMFKKRISTADQSLITELKKIVTSQTLYPGNPDRQKLFQAAPQQIEKLLQKWQNQPEPETDPDDRRAQAIKFFQDLWEIKTDLGRLRQLTKLLESPTPVVPARLLLESMFALVTQRMHLRNWPKMPADEFYALVDPETDTLPEQALDYQTIIDDTVAEKTLVDQTVIEETIVDDS